MRGNLRGGSDCRPKPQPVRRRDEVAEQPGPLPQAALSRPKGLLLQLQVVLDVPGEKRRVVDHDKVLKSMAFERLSLDLRQLNRQTSPIRDDVGLRPRCGIGEANPRGIGLWKGKEPLRQFRGKISRDAELPMGGAMRFDMDFPLTQTAPLAVKSDQHFQRFEEAGDVRGFVRRHLLDRV
jgi:hypothetical protein